jgi:hypothetical protein
VRPGGYEPSLPELLADEAGFDARFAQAQTIETIEARYPRPWTIQAQRRWQKSRIVDAEGRWVLSDVEPVLAAYLVACVNHPLIQVTQTPQPPDLDATLARIEDMRRRYEHAQRGDSSSGIRYFAEHSVASIDESA